MTFVRGAVRCGAIEVEREVHDCSKMSPGRTGGCWRLDWATRYGTAGTAQNCAMEGHDRAPATSEGSSPPSNSHERKPVARLVEAGYRETCPVQVGYPRWLESTFQ